MKKTLLIIQHKNQNNNLSHDDLILLNYIYRLFFKQDILVEIGDDDFQNQITNYIRKVVVKIQIELKPNLYVIKSYLTN